MAISFKIHPRKDYIKKDGTSTLYLWVRLNRKLKKYPLPYSIDYDKWDWNNNKYKGSSIYAHTLNSYIVSELGKVNTIAVNIAATGNELSFMSFDRAYLNSSNNDVFDYIQSFIDKNKGRLSESYIRQHKAGLSKLKRFRSQLQFSDIDHKFLREYEHHLRTTLKNSTNTVHKTLKQLRTIINEAMLEDEKLYTRSPFAGYKLRTEPTQRLFLTKGELDLLYSMRDEFRNKTKNVVNYFLFSCYTGLRHIDIKNLTWRNIGADRVEVKMIKTKETIVIPLIEKAKKLLPEPGNLEDEVFRVLSNQKTNDYLKLAIEKAGINKNITFHCARHTFATVALNSGIPLEIIQKLLGHSVIKTTQIYSKVLTETLFDQMSKME